MKKRILALILSALFVSFALISCANDKDSDVTAVANNDDIISNETTSETTSVTTMVEADVPEKDYSQKEFMILTYDNGNLETRIYMNSVVEAENGDIINDALFKRNLKIEERFNLKIQQYATKNVESTAKKAIMSNDSAYDAIISSISHIRSLGTSGYLVNMYDVPFVDMTREYWDANFAKQLTIQGKLFFNTGDITVYDDMRVASIIFNKGLWEEHSLENPYELVLNGKWTIDKMMELASNVTRDLDGDAILGQADRWGILSEYGAGNDFFFASGERMITLDENGNPKIVFGSERSAAAAAKMLEITLDSANVFLADKIKSDDVWKTAALMFQQDQVLMRTSAFETVPRDLRAMDTDFGVLPFAKFDEEQEEHYSFARNDSYVVCVPTSAEDIECSGIILEALSAESSNTLKPAFYDLSLQGKVLRDNDSQAMLDIIFKNKVYDIGINYSIGQFESLLNNLVSSGKNTFVSKLSGSMKSAEAALAKLVTAYDKL